MTSAGGTETPETDALAALLATGRHTTPDDDAYEELARKLERERNEAREALQAIASLKMRAYILLMSAMQRTK